MGTPARLASSAWAGCRLAARETETRERPGRPRTATRTTQRLAGVARESFALLAKVVILFENVTALRRMM